MTNDINYCLRQEISFSFKKTNSLKEIFSFWIHLIGTSILIHSESMVKALFNPKKLFVLHLVFLIFLSFIDEGWWLFGFAFEFISLMRSCLLFDWFAGWFAYLLVTLLID